MLNRGDRRAQESGAILVLTAALLLVLIGFAALAVDLGNAWSNDRRVQTAVDLGTVSALYEVPHTFRAGTNAVTTLGKDAAETEVLNELTSLTAVNAPDAVIVSETLMNDYTDYDVELSMPSNNSFARAIGGGNAVTVTSSAGGHIEVNDPSLDVMPLGFNSTGGNPYRCLWNNQPSPAPQLCTHDGATPSPSTDVLMLGQRRRDLSPMCEDVDDTMIANFRTGIDHLVDLWSTGNRDEKLACDDGHSMTMPTTSQVVPPIRYTAILPEGLGAAGGRLAGDGAQLWDFLEPSLGGGCDAAAINALPDLEEKASAMGSCLSSGFAQFEPTLNSQTRLVWAFDTSPGGTTVVYDDYVPVWLHHVIDATGQEFMVPPGGIEAATMFILDESMLATPLEFDPGGIDNLEFIITS